MLFLLLVLVAQLPIGIVVAWDARRVGMDSQVWGMGILLPLGGFVVIPAYLYERRRATEK